MAEAESMDTKKLPAPVSYYCYGAGNEYYVLIWSDSGGWSFAIADKDKKIRRAAYMWPSKKLAIELACLCLVSLCGSSEMILKETRYTYATNPTLEVRSSGSKWRWEVEGKQPRLSNSKSSAITQACKELK